MGNKKDYVLYTANLDWGKYVPKLVVKSTGYHYYDDSLELPDDYYEYWERRVDEEYFREAVSHAVSVLNKIGRRKHYLANKKSLLRYTQKVCDDIKRIFDLIENLIDDSDGDYIYIEHYNRDELREDFASLIESLAACAAYKENDATIIETLNYALKSDDVDILELVANIELLQKIADYRMFVNKQKESADLFYGIIDRVVRARIGTHKTPIVSNDNENYWILDSLFRMRIDKIRRGEFNNLPRFIPYLRDNTGSLFDQFKSNCKKKSWLKAIDVADNIISVISDSMADNKTRPEYRREIMLAEAIKECLAYYFIKNNLQSNLNYGEIARNYRNNPELNSINVYLDELDKNGIRWDQGFNDKVVGIANAEEIIKKLWDQLKLNEEHCGGGPTENYNENLNEDNELPEQKISQIAYYTKLDTLGYLLPQTGKLDEIGVLSMMHLAYMNDPNEGKALPGAIFNGLVEKDTRENAKYPYVFLKSFTRRIDDLPMWEMYGDRAEGVCIVIDPLQFAQQKSSIPMYFVCYLRKEKNNYVVKPEDNSNLSRSSVKTINRCLRQIRTWAKKNKDDASFMMALGDSLQGIKFMFKDSDYSHECELRIVYIADEHSDDRIKQTVYPTLEKGTTSDSDMSQNSILKYDKAISYETGKAPMLYVSAEDPIIIDEIILGPKFKESARELPFLERRCDELCQKHSAFYNGKSIKITFSDIKYN